MAGTPMAGMAMGKGMWECPWRGLYAATPNKPMTMPAGADLSDLTYDSLPVDGRGNQEPWTGVAGPASASGCACERRLARPSSG